MPWSIVKGGGTCAASEWAVVNDENGNTEGCHETEEEAREQQKALYVNVPEGSEAAAETEATPSVLTETWIGPIARSKLTGDGRDFTATDWSWRDPVESRLPLMWQTETADGHYAARQAGWITRLWLEGDAVMAEGSFFDSDQGRGLRDSLAAAGRWGVSVDPGKYDVEDVCLDFDDEGFCVEGQTVFHAYEVIGVTATPFPAFEDAYIELAGMESTEVDEPIAASALARPPARFFANPDLTEPTLLTIDDDGHVYGHVATFEQCHMSFQHTCITAPPKVAMSLFHTGTVMTAEGKRISTGPLIMGTDHAAVDPQLGASGAIDHYAHTGCAWADVRLGTDEIGIWCAGALRPGLTEDQIRVLRGSGLSGDWRSVNGDLQLCAVLAVNTPGFPIPASIVAAGSPFPREVSPLRARLVAGTAVAATGLGAIRCPECRRRAQSVRGELVELHATPDTRIDEVLALLRSIELRTRPMKVVARDHILARLRNGS